MWYIMNQTGQPIKVFVSNLACVTLTKEEIDENQECKVLGPRDGVGRKCATVAGWMRV